MTLSFRLLAKKKGSRGSLFCQVCCFLWDSCEKYLVLGVKNHPRANCSLFFVLDKNLDIVYEEHSLHAFEIGMYHDEKYGDCVIVKSGNFHPYNVKGDEKYYMYYLPKMERLADAPVR